MMSYSREKNPLPLSNQVVSRKVLLTAARGLIPAEVLSFLNIYYHEKLGDSFILRSLYLYIDSLRQSFRTFGIEYKVRIGENFMFWFCSGLMQQNEVEFVKMLKFEIACPIATFMKNKLPPRPEVNPILGRHMLTFFKHVTSFMSKDKAGSIAACINNLKRVFPNLPVAYRKAMEVKHSETISKIPKAVPSYIMKKVSRITKELFPRGWDRSYEQEISFKQASCLTHSRGKGGQLGAWKEELTRALEGPNIIITDTEGHCHIENLDSFTRDHVNRFEFKERYEAKAECVEDPLKIRIITKNMKEFGLLKGVQRAMWKRLSQFPSFVFTGTPAASGYFSPLFSTLDLNKSKNLWISGDYASATDNFIPEVSEQILRDVLGNSVEIDLKTIGIANESITRHIVHYNYIESAIQENGQMMGSLLSFPVLCIYNFALFHISMEKYLKTRLSTSWTTKRVLINGDDILFVATEKLYKIWWDTVLAYGLEPSVGKNFSNNKYFTINSMLFKWDYKSRTARSILFPRIQFLYTVNKVSMDKIKKVLVQSTLPSLLSALEKDEREYDEIPFRMDSFKKRLLKAGGKIYNRFDFRGIFLERSRGGHGIEPLEGSKIRVNTRQARYEKLYRKGNSVREYLQEEEMMEFEWSVPRRLRNKWERKYVPWVPTMEECLVEVEYKVKENLRLELRKLRPLSKRLNEVSPRIQLRRFKN